MKSTIIRRIVGASAAVALTAGLGLASTPKANAADVWDKVAKCESSGNWSINTGNGFYGGLQFTKQTWKGFGGGKYASTANKASKAEQIAIARRVLAVQGPGAWPVCSRKAGLTKSNGGADRNAMPGKAAPKKSTPKKKAPKKAAPKKSTPKKSAPKKAAPKSSKTVTLRSGDTMSKLARKYNVRGGWKALAKANPQIKNPDVLKVGQRVRIP